MDNAMYSALQVLRAISDSNLLTQSIGHPEYVMTKLAQESADCLRCEVCFNQEPAKSLST